MQNRVSYIERLPDLSDTPYNYRPWQELLEKHFASLKITDITDIDHTDCHTFLISLIPNQTGFDSPKLDAWLAENDAYFLEASISQEKKISYCLFWFYPQGSKGQVLHTSLKPFLAEQQVYADSFASFAGQEGLLLLNYEELSTLVWQDQEQVTLYYKYFGQYNDEPLVLPFQS